MQIRKTQSAAAISVEEEKETVLYFTPEENGVYRFFSEAEGKVDPGVKIYKGGVCCNYADDTQNSLNFDITFYFEAGVKYEFRLAEMSGAEAVYSVSLRYVADVDYVNFSPASGGYIYFGEYDSYPAFEVGDKVTVSLEDGTVNNYYYREELADFFSIKTKTYISGDFGYVPQLLPLFDEDTGEFLYEAKFVFLNFEGTIEIEEGKSPIASIEYTPARPVIAVENVSGSIVEYGAGNSFFMYNCKLSEGDILTVTYKNGAADNFTLRCKITNTGNDYYFESADGRTPDKAYLTVDYLSDQAENHWAPGSHYITVYYYDCECRIPVQVIKPGWYSESGKWYYYDGEKGVQAEGWNKIGGKWYLFSSVNGAMLTGWQKSGGKWYYFNPSGAMVSGWQKLGNKWYYFNPSGAMASGWQKLGSKWYYFNSSGAMAPGWQKLGGKWYSSGDMKTGWLKSAGKWYYFESSGVMAAGKSLKISKKTYKFNSSGVCINP